MKRLEEKECRVSFSDPREMKGFLHEMIESDEEVVFQLNSIETYADQEDLMLKGITDTKMIRTEKLWPFAIKSLEKRSGDNAKGHELMTDAQVLSSMNNYWKLHKDKETCIARIRGGKILGLGSKQYEIIDQEQLLKVITDWLDDRHPGKYTFREGYYTHQLTYAKFDIDDAISPTYVSAWKKAGLPQSLLDQSHISVTLMTDDTAECAAKALIEMAIAGTRFILGNPIEVIHRSGYGGIDGFKKEMEKVDMSIRTELDALSDLMGVTLVHPEQATIMALKKAGIPKISKKACKELIDDLLFGGTESAYIVYLNLHGILDTSIGRALSDERRLRIVLALRGLLKEDWSRFDVPSASL